MPSTRRYLLALVVVAAICLFLYFPEQLITDLEPSTNPTDGADSKDELSSSDPKSTLTSVQTTSPGNSLVHGFVLLDRLYLRNGTFFIVTANNSLFPPKNHMISPLMDIGAGHNMEPTDRVSSSTWQGLN